MVWMESKYANVTNTNSIQKPVHVIWHIDDLMWTLFGVIYMMTVNRKKNTLWKKKWTCMRCALQYILALLYLIAFAPGWKLKMLLRASLYKASYSSSQVLSTLSHSPVDLMVYPSLLLGLILCFRVLHLPQSHSCNPSTQAAPWWGPACWGAMLKQMQQPLRSDSDLFTLLLCARTQMLRCCTVCVCVWCVWYHSNVQCRAESVIVSEKW